MSTSSGGRRQRRIIPILPPQRQQRNILHFSRLALTSLLLLTLLPNILSNNNNGGRQQQREDSSSSPSRPHYEWENYDFYQILSLSPPPPPPSDDDDYDYKLPTRRKRKSERNKIKPSDVRKAYRKQAQLYHPDKHGKGRKLKKGGNVTTESSSEGSGSRKQKEHRQSSKAKEEEEEREILTVEESTARFARIAEAYEVLSDVQKRLEYDDYLLDFEEERYREQQARRAARAATEMKRGGKRGGSRGGMMPGNGGDGNGNGGSRFSGSSSLFDKFTEYASVPRGWAASAASVDPMSVFENFFFGGYTGGGPGSASEDPFSEFHSDYYYPPNRSGPGGGGGRSGADYRPPQYRPPPNLPPARISETTQVRYDPRYRTEVLRVLRKEEFVNPHTGYMGYYRIVGQEFVEEFEMDYYGMRRSLGYRALGEPYLVEEGFADDDEEEPGRTSMPNNRGRSGREHGEYRHQQQQQQQREPREERRFPSKMLPDEYLTPTSPLLTSPSGHYYAGLTPQCELLIMSDSGSGNDDEDDDEDDEDEVFWSSDTYSHTSRCYLSLHGGQLVLALGTPHDPGGVLWYSDAPNLVPDRESAGTGGEYYYFVSLDDDGSLAVYRRWSVSDDDDSEETKREEEEEGGGGSDNNDGRKRRPVFKSWWSNLLRRVRQDPRQSSKQETRASAAWLSVRRWAARTLTPKNDDGTHQRKQQTKTKRPKDRCIYATGPAGCLTPGRHAVRIANAASRSMKGAASTVNTALNDFVDTLQRGSEDDDDLLDTLVRVLGNAGTGVIRMGRRVVRKGFQEGKMVTKVVRDNVRERWRRWSHGHSGGGRVGG